MKRWALVLAAVALCAPFAGAQSPLPQDASQTPAGPGNPAAEPAEKAKRPGLFHLGPFWLSPTFHVNGIGLDTNVFYTSTERQTDVSASGGPGLDLILPLGETGRFFTKGKIDYLYFVRTPSQRRLNGSVNPGLEFKGARTSLLLDQLWGRTYGRPSYEVNDRVETYVESTHLDISRRLFGRLSLKLEGARARTDTSSALYLGVDLKNTLSETRYLARAGLAYAITVKTSFVVEGDQQWDRFLYDPTRDADSNRFLVGFRTDESALVAGHALVGRRSFRPTAFPDVDQRLTVADVDANLNISSRTKLGGFYLRDLNYSAFATSGETPTVRTESYGARFTKFLTSQVDLQLYGRITRFVTDGTITVDIPDQGVVVAVRDDRVRDAGADLGYRFRSRLRIGVAATYTSRQSSISYFGIEGLLFGLTINYTP